LSSLTSTSLKLILVTITMSALVSSCSRKSDYTDAYAYYDGYIPLQTNLNNSNLVQAEGLSADQIKKAQDLIKQDQEEAENEDKEAEKVTTSTIIPKVKPSIEPVILPSGVKKFDLRAKFQPFEIDKMFEPSALCTDEKGNLFTVSDKLSTSIYRIWQSGNKYQVNEDIKTSTGQVFKLRLKKKNRFDFEGLEYLDGLFYVADERDRRVYTIDKSGNIKDLEIDVNGYMDSHNIGNKESNSGLEGLTIDPVNKKMFLMKERQESAILVADMKTNKIERHFKLNIPGTVEPALTDASFYNGFLYVLVRSHRQIVKVNPETGEVASIYDYRKYEENPDYVYRKVPNWFGSADSDGYGVMEGLAVTKDSFYVASDNNMIPSQHSVFNNKPIVFVFDKPE
jgi:glutamine cyclotransferase